MTDTAIATAAPETTADPMAAPMHAALQAALTPYLEGDLDPTTDLVEALLDVLAAAEPTPGLISTLHHAVTGLVPTPELMGPMHHAVGAALSLPHPTPYQATRSTQSTTRISASAAATRPGSIAERISKLFAANPGTPFRVGDLVKALGDAVSGGGAVGAALNGMVTRGEAVLVSTGPKLYLSARDTAEQATAPELADTATEPLQHEPAGADVPAETDAEPQDAAVEPAEATEAEAAAEPADAKARPARRGKGA
ncbi:hypothetical protein [Actinospica robiniae]|uniref:hypothetical protein n=1 Tax=Actinospica robiniae TaxID=304901 RepID=UPI0004174FEC|nr:hypothetical protein [Actinospica robiniae]